MPQPLRVFFSYAHEDDRHGIRLEKSLKLLERQGLVESSYDRKLLPGDDWSEGIHRELERAELILLLLSADLFASDYIDGVELKRALARHDIGEARVVPILVRACDWQTSPLGRFQALPENATAVTSWANEDEAWADVARERPHLRSGAGAGIGSR